MRRLLTAIAVGVFGCLLVGQTRDQSNAAAEQYIQKSEGEWAASLANGDVRVPERILAADFLGIEPDGSFYDRRAAVAETREGPKTFVSNHVNQVKVRFYGDTAVVQGDESFVKRSGAPLRGRYVWTDVWVRRKGQWQVVSAQDVAVAEPAAKK